MGTYTKQAGESHYKRCCMLFLFSVFLIIIRNILIIISTEPLKIKFSILIIWKYFSEINNLKNDGNNLTEELIKMWYVCDRYKKKMLASISVHELIIEIHILISKWFGLIILKCKIVKLILQIKRLIIYLLCVQTYGR